ncbi:uncharacterized protein mslnb isoform X1 [Takifugu flavidus]|uniref:uncharacterized protein mslnb isoform X1 n=1 Tax=Takifugu flavidus TaxID=433684 RepID=UPI002544D092|nr:uncharacterized protein mslnb isoform X1 [Takifugu flavidus]
MRSRNLFLLVYFAWGCFGSSGPQISATCAPAGMCEVPNPTWSFLQCVGLPPTDAGRDHIHRLKQILEAAMDVYTFMKSSMKGVPVLSLQGALHLNPKVDPHQNEAVIQMWMEVKLKPLLHSITKHFLSCLSTKNFSCSTYQNVVKELSHHFSEMNPVRQKWIYTFFMYPFLSGDRVDGCVRQNETGEDWLVKNFGAFKAMARLQDFSTLNMAFSGLEVLHLLSPVQKAELLMRPEVASLDNATLTLIFHNLLTGGSNPKPTAFPGGGYNWTSPMYPPTTHNPQLPLSTRNGLREVVNGFMTAFKPIGSFVHEFVTFTRVRNVSEIKSTTFTQFLLNWTLSELADMYRSRNASVAPQGPKFDVTDVEDWYRQVVLPLLRRFLPNAEALMHENIKLAFHQVFYLEHGLGPDEENETSEIQDVCSITLDKAPCGLTDAVVNVAKVLHCAARTNLTMTEANLMQLVYELTGRLNSLVRELAAANFSEVASDFRNIFTEEEPPTLPQEHLNDPSFIALWFKVKLLPLLPAVPVHILSCLSTKNFTCPVFHTIVGALGHHMSAMKDDPKYSHNVYKYLIYQHLWHRNGSDPQCVSSANHSAEWLLDNFGFFSSFASMADFYRLNPNFSGLEVLPHLSPNQTAELLLLPLPAPPEKDVIIDRVFEFLLESPEDRRLSEVLSSLVRLAREVEPPCSTYRHIFERLYKAIPSLPPRLEPLVWAGIDELITITPDECLPANITCLMTQYNASKICRGIHSSDLQAHLNTSVDVPCNFTLETYACAQENFTAQQLASLLKCNLPGNSSHSRMIWKMLLTKSIMVLDPALDILANMSMSIVVPSATEVLDVIREIRLNLLTEEQLRNQSVITRWFSRRLSRLLPYASAQFLTCLSLRNLSCHSYQQIIQVFSHHFDKMTTKQQEVVMKDFIEPFLSQSGQRCLSISINSSDWLMKNLGPFSRFLPVKTMLELNSGFNPLEVLQLLTPTQNAELLVLSHPTLDDKDAIINMIFDYLPQSAPKFTHFLSELLKFLPMGNLSCSSYKTLLKRLDLALDTVALDVGREIMNTKMALSTHIPPGCVIYSGQCNVTITNETVICAGVNSTTVQLLLDSGLMSGGVCGYPVEELACASLSALKAEDLAALLACNRTWNSSSTMSVWKLLLSKSSMVLDQALDLLSNKTLDPRNPALTMILDSISQVRLDRLNPSSFNNLSVINLWFNQRLRPFLPGVSPNFLSCLTRKGLNCSTYQHIVQIFSSLMEKMSDARQMSVYNHFIKVYLTRINTTDPGCTTHSSNSSDWLMKNLGPFSRFLPVKTMLELNSGFNPLEVLQLLTPTQNAELLVLSHPTLDDKDAIINMIFDYLPQSAPKFTHFLSELLKFLPMGNLSCSSYKTLLKRLDLALDTVALDVGREIKMALSTHIPPGCVIYSGQCNVTITNETVICAGVNSTTVQLLLDSGLMSGGVCGHPVEELACASLSALKAEDLAALLACNRTWNSSSTMSVWKLLLSKSSQVLDQALDLLANKTLDPRNPALTMILDSINQVRLDRLNSSSFNNLYVINLWFNQRLRPFLPGVSPNFLSCLTRKGLNCSTYQHIVQIFSSLMEKMSDARQMSVYNHFIKVYLTRINTTDPGCTTHSSNSSDWLMKNLGPFSRFLPVKTMLELNSGFNPLEVLQLLTPTQNAELLVLSHPTLDDKDAIINMIFDYLPQSAPKFTHFLSELLKFLPMGNLSCSSYKTLLKRLDLALDTVALDVGREIMNTRWPCPHTSLQVVSYTADSAMLPSQTKRSFVLE